MSRRKKKPFPGTTRLNGIEMVDAFAALREAFPDDKPVVLPGPVAASDVHLLGILTALPNTVRHG